MITEKIRGYVVRTSLGISAIALTLATKVSAAADADVVSSSAYVANTFKENMVAVITGNIGTLISVGVLVLGIFFIWKVGKKFLGSK